MKKLKLRKLPKFIRFEIADDTNAMALRPYVMRVVKALGHGEAMVTDESMVLDFLDVFMSKAGKVEAVYEASKKLGVDIDLHDRVWEAADRLKKKEAKIDKADAHVAQLEEHVLGKDDVGGSKPPVGSRRKRKEKR